MTKFSETVIMGYMPTNLPPGFTHRPNGLVSGPSKLGEDWVSVWTATPYTGSLTYGERNKLADREVAYLTGAARMGWNVRASFPKAWVLRELPFVYVANGRMTMFRYYGHARKVAA